MNNINSNFITPLAGAILGLLLALLALRRRGWRDRAVRMLLLYLAALVVWQASLAVLHVRHLELAPTTFPYAAFGLALLFLQLSRLVLRYRGLGWGWWALGALGLCGSTLVQANPIGLPDLLWLGGNVIIERLALARDVLLVGWGIMSGGTAVLTYRAYRRSPQPLHRNRITYWLLAQMLLICAAAALFASREATALTLYIAGTLTVASVVLVHYLPDVRRVARVALYYLIVTLLAFLVYGALLVGAWRVRELRPDAPPLAIVITAALAGAIALNPLLRQAERLLGRVAGLSRPEAAPTLREYSTQISNILDLEQLAETSVGFICKELGIRGGILCVVHQNEGYFHLRVVKGAEGSALSCAIPDGGPIAMHLGREGKPLTQYDVDLHPRFQDITSDEREWFSSLGMDVYLPIHAHGEWIGLLALASKLSGDRYYDDELLLLSTLAEQTAMALENARLFADLKERYEEIERLNKELARTDQAKSAFLNIASHELRTPLTQVRGYTDILREMAEGGTLTPGTAQKAIGGLKAAAMRLEEIVDLMFDVAQLDTETLELTLLQESVADIVSAAADEWSEALKERGQTLTMEGLAELPPIQADYKRLRQVFSHLIQNAIKFTPDGGSIHISGRVTEWGETDRQAVEIIVADTGIGIAPEELERIFDKFYRTGNVLLHSTGRTKFKGAGPGLGLALARGIVQAHGGRIWAESPGYDEENCPGSKFHIILPLP